MERTVPVLFFGDSAFCGMTQVVPCEKWRMPERSWSVHIIFYKFSYKSLVMCVKI